MAARYRAVTTNNHREHHHTSKQRHCKLRKSSPKKNHSWNKLHCFIIKIQKFQFIWLVLLPLIVTEMKKTMYKPGLNEVNGIQAIFSRSYFHHIFIVTDPEILWPMSGTFPDLKAMARIQHRQILIWSSEINQGAVHTSMKTCSCSITKVISKFLLLTFKPVCWYPINFAEEADFWVGIVELHNPNK